MREGPREYRGDFPVPLGSGQFVNLVGRIGRLDPKGVALSFVNDNVKRLLWVPEEIIKPTGSTLHLQLFSVPYPRDQKKRNVERQTQMTWSQELIIYGHYQKTWLR